MPLIIPDDALREAGLSENDARIEFACRLFEAGKLSLWGAARLAGLSRVELEGELLARQIPWLRPDETELADDLAALDRSGDLNLTRGADEMESVGAGQSGTTSIPTSEEGSEMIANRDIDQGQSPTSSATTPYPPNTLALAILQAVRERQSRRNPSPSRKTQDYIREARSGGMYGHDDGVGQ